MSVEAHRRLEAVQRMDDALLVEDRQLVLDARIAERGLQEEAVELGLRQRERALVLDRVLGGEQQEGVGQLARDAVHGHLALGHRLEQRRLRLRRRAVHLVDEHDVREDRPGPELEVARALVEHREARDVRRLKVGRALDARSRRALDRARDRARQHRLRRARHVLEQHVAAARHRRQHELDLLALAEDDGLDVREEPVGYVDRTVKLGHLLERNLGFHRPLDRSPAGRRPFRRRPPAIVCGSRLALARLRERRLRGCQRAGFARRSHVAVHRDGVHGVAEPERMRDRLTARPPGSGRRPPRTRRRAPARSTSANCSWTASSLVFCSQPDAPPRFLNSQIRCETCWSVPGCLETKMLSCIARKPSASSGRRLRRAARARTHRASTARTPP